MFALSALAGAQEQPGSIRGTVYDKDFEVPLGAATVQVVEAGLEVTTSTQGNYVFNEMPPGTYTLVFSKEGYLRQVKGDVVVTPGQLTEVNVELAGDFVDMEEFVVQDVLQLDAGSEAALLKIRFESPSLMDSISSDLMSRAGASDAAAALKLVSGASVEGGRFAVIRGLPDRYVSSQLNGVRLPTADEDKRAVELDQFPAVVIESIQVTKTFTPDQQGDASGGAVNVKLRGIPEEPIFQVKGEVSFNSNVSGRSDFLSYSGGGVDGLGMKDVDPQLDNLGESWDGPVGVSRTDAPTDYKFSGAYGGKYEVNRDWTVGAFASLFYERDSSFFDDGINDAYWVETPGEPLSPEKKQDQGGGDFLTSLFDVTQATESLQWGGLGVFGAETDNHAFALNYLYTHTAEDRATLAVDTRGKEFFFPGHDPNDPLSPGSSVDELSTAPYLRSQTLEYTERTTQTIQLTGAHVIEKDGFDLLDALEFQEPEVDWTVATSFAKLHQPDKRLFGEVFFPESFDPGTPGFSDPGFDPPGWGPFKPAANINLGNLQRIFKDIDEDSLQFALDLKFPFEQWDREEGYLKVGAFDDSVEREFDQNTFSNFGDPGTNYSGQFGEPWSDVFPFEDHPVFESETDVDYEGELDVRAVYGMFDLPLSERLNVIAGARFETTDISIVNFPEKDALWFPEGALLPETLDPGEGDADFSSDDLLPAVALVYELADGVTVRAAYSQTIARQTFKELTPILQQEFVGGPIFIGNPDLELGQLENYDLRIDYVPYDGGLVSASYFYKDLEDAIEYVTKEVNLTFTSPENYPDGEISGVEFELRQSLGRFREELDGLGFGGNVTFINSSVTLPDDEAAALAGLGAPITSRDATFAPEHLYNLFLTYDLADTKTKLALFYTVKGDTLVSGAGESKGNFVPSVYAKEFGTLNFSLSQGLGDHLTLTLKAKNLTNPEIQEVFRSNFSGPDVVKTSFTRGVDFSIGLTFVP